MDSISPQRLAELREIAARECAGASWFLSTTPAADTWAAHFHAPICWWHYIFIS